LNSLGNAARRYEKGAMILTSSPQPLVASMRAYQFGGSNRLLLVAVREYIRGNGVPYAPQISHAVSDKPGGYGATPEKKPKKGHCIAHANSLCRQRGIGSMRIRRFGYARPNKSTLRFNAMTKPSTPSRRRIEWNSERCTANWLIVPSR
jgi:hypothetical protein